MSVTAGVSDTVIAVRDKLRGKIGQTKVKRYWPGKAPEWADDDDDGNDKDEKDIRTTSRASLDKAFGNDNGSAGKDDPRLRRLADRRVENRDEARADHRRIRKAEILSTIEEETRKQEGLEAEEDDEDAVEERRRRIKERLRQREIEEAPILEEEEEEEDEESSGSEYETDSDEDGFSAAAMVKPVFVPKSERDTVAERERLEAEEEALEEAKRKMVEERKRETKRIVVEEIRKDQEIQRSTEQQEANAGDVDTDDEANEAEEYEGWKSREMARIKRDREEREAMAREREEIEKLRNMTEEERREWERKNPKLGSSSSSSSSRQKQKWRFMQKYYHKGAFFQAETEAASEARDFSAPTGEDKMDKTILPKIMQVKHFGRSGRTKWTHLVNEDTTDWNNPWTYNDPLRAKYSAKMAGMNAPITKPKGSKKLKDWEQR